MNAKIQNPFGPKKISFMNKFAFLCCELAGKKKSSPRVEDFKAHTSVRAGCNNRFIMSQFPGSSVALRSLCWPELQFTDSWPNFQDSSAARILADRSENVITVFVFNCNVIKTRKLWKKKCESISVIRSFHKFWKHFLLIWLIFRQDL